MVGRAGLALGVQFLVASLRFVAGASSSDDGALTVASVLGSAEDDAALSRLTETAPASLSAVADVSYSSASGARLAGASTQDGAASVDDATLLDQMFSDAGSVRDTAAAESISNGTEGAASLLNETQDDVLLPADNTSFTEGASVNFTQDSNVPDSVASFLDEAGFGSLESASAVSSLRVAVNATEESLQEEGALTLQNQTEAVALGSASEVASLVNETEFDALESPSNASLTLGTTANLTQEGYMAITMEQDAAAMMVFVRRLLDNGARIVTDRKGLKMFALRHSVPDPDRNFTSMKSELGQHQKTWWVSDGPGKTAPLNNVGFEMLAAMQDRNQMRAFLRRVVNSLGLEIVNNNMVDNLAAELGGAKVSDRYHDLCELLRLPRFTKPGPEVDPEEVPMTEDGYARLASEKNNQKMEVFVQRVLASEGRSVLDDSGLQGFVPYYSGVEKTWSLQAMRSELRHAWWVDAGLGRQVPLDEEGFDAVASTGSTQHMKAFIRRLATVNGRMVLSEGELSGMVPFFSGERASQPFGHLLQQVEHARRAHPAGIQPAQVKKNKRLRHRHHHHHLPAVSLLEVDAERQQEGSGLGASAPLNDDGYAMVAESDEVVELKDYIRRVLEAEARSVKDSAGLAAFASQIPATHGAHKLAELKQDLRSRKNAWWLADGVGKTAALSEEGYQLVLAAKSDKQMKAFMRRVAKSEGQVVVNEGTLSGLVPYFSGKKHSMTFHDMQRALLSQGVTSVGI